jgi:hypothetical protein
VSPATILSLCRLLDWRSLLPRRISSPVRRESKAKSRSGLFDPRKEVGRSAIQTVSQRTTGSTSRVPLERPRDALDGGASAPPSPVYAAIVRVGRTLHPDDTKDRPFVQRLLPGSAFPRPGCELAVLPWGSLLSAAAFQRQRMAVVYPYSQGGSYEA